MTEPLTDFIAIDPGTRESALLWYRSDQEQPIQGAVILPNDEALRVVLGARDYGLPVVCEMVASYGMAVGKDVFETVFWIGRFCQAADEFHRVYRLDVKLHLCKDSRAQDANIRQALIDRFPATGGGKTPQIGTKAQPGPLYGMKSHLWAALGVAVTFADKQEGSTNGNSAN